jgi:hypothetical protein
LDEINVNNDNNYVIEHDTLEEINKEFNSYILQKHSMLKLIRDFNEKMNSSVNDLKMPCIEKFLSNNFASSSNQNDKICKYCEKFIPKSLSSHYRYCSAKPTEITKLEPSINLTNDSSDPFKIISSHATYLASIFAGIDEYFSIKNVYAKNAELYSYRVNVTRDSSQTEKKYGSLQLAVAIDEAVFHNAKIVNLSLSYHGMCKKGKQ